ncbi:MAG TPA: ABC transporter substrate-binding protein [Trueperaceae bacterium]|nr:ABC transporter substrate-binding protein [Trueperaceae bacterium]
MKRLTLIAAAVLALSGLAAAQTLVYGESGLPVNLDLPQDGNSLSVQYQVAEPLVLYKPGTTEIRPGLATSWEANDSATVWTFHLRQGVTFQDGTPFNAEAVKFNFDRWNHRDNPYAFPGTKDMAAWTYIFGAFYGESGYLLEKVDAVDDSTVRFTLTQPTGFFPTLLSSSYFGMQSPAAIKKAGAAYGTPSVGLVGTGPFKFQEWVEGDHVTLVRNDNYWGDKAGVERIVFKGIESAPTRLAQLEAGTLDIAVNLSPDDYKVVTGNQNLKQASSGPELSIGYVGFHQANKPFDDVRVRQAVAYAVDQQAIVDAFYGPLGSVATEFIPPGLMGRSDVKAYPYDPEKAKQLLAEAGYPNGFDTKFWYMPVSRPYYPAPKDVAEAFVGYLADVGINAQLNTEDWSIYLSDYDQGKFPMYMLGWNADYPDPNNFINTFFNASESVNGFGWSDANGQKVVSLLSQAAQASDQSTRELDYELASTIIHDQIPALPMVYPRSLNATRTNIDGFLPNAMGTTVSLATVTKK